MPSLGVCSPCYHLSKLGPLWKILGSKARTKLQVPKRAVGYPNEIQSFFKCAITLRSLSPKRIIVLLFFFGLAVLSSGKVCNIYWAINLKESNKKTSVSILIMLFCSQIYSIIQKLSIKLHVNRGFRLKVEF